MKRFLLFVACLTSVGAATQRVPDPTLPDLLIVAGRYIDTYERDFAAIVSEERYEQTANERAASTGPMRRVMKSDLLTYYSGAVGWIAFRDVVEVDGVPVAGHSELLLKLVREPTTHAMEDARRATDASARYNIGMMARTTNSPTAALMFLRRENQSRSRFELDGMKTVDKLRVALVRFQEIGDARMVSTPDDTPATGRFWIEPTSGRVVQTELTLESRHYAAKIAVTYADQPKLALSVPVRMTENYSESGTAYNMARPAIINARAEYQNFRRFETKGRMIIK